MVRIKQTETVFKPNCRWHAAAHYITIIGRSMHSRTGTDLQGSMPGAQQQSSTGNNWAHLAPQNPFGFRDMYRL